MSDARRDITMGQLAAVGFDAGAEVSTIRDTAAVTRQAATMAALGERLTSALVAGDSEAATRALLDLDKDDRRTTELLRAAADQATRRAYPWRKAYAFAAARFDETAREFAEACRSVDPDEPADNVVQLRNPARANWASIPKLSATLEARFRLLNAVAASVINDYSPNATTDQMRVCIDAGKARGAEAAFKGPGSSRGGRWADLVRIGCTLRAADLDSLAGDSGA
jgi:hypothetical protein